MLKAKSKKFYAAITALLLAACIPNMTLALTILPAGGIGHSELSHLWITQDKSEVNDYIGTAPAIGKELIAPFYRYQAGECLRE